jgi:hypothetical protein
MEEEIKVNDEIEDEYFEDDELLSFTDLDSEDFQEE